MKFCCDKFAEKAGAPQAPVGGGVLYPDELLLNAQFEQTDNDNWAINGCCGGGCYVVEEMKFCPYCGTQLTTLEG